MAGKPEPAVNFRADREGEMRALEDALLGEPGRIAVVHGAPGAGKSALAHRFMKQHADRFPGGQELISAFPLEAGGHTPELLHAQPSLLVVDEADRISIDRLLAIVREARSRRPYTTLLMTANTPVLVTPDTLLVEMPPLRPAQILTLLAASANIERHRLDALVPLLAGNAEAADLASRRLASGVPPERIVEWFESGRFAVAHDPDGKPLGEGSEERTKLDIEMSEVSDELIRELSARPELMYRLDPRKFEQLVAELYRRRGFEAILTPASGDEGADVYVVSRSDLGQTLWVVQAKRNAPNRKIKAGTVRELLGTIHAKNASAGVLITTSFFQPGAKALEQEFKYQLSLKDYLDLQALLRGDCA